MELLTTEAAHLVYDSIIVSTLKYNCIVNLNLNSSQQSKLKPLQRRAESLFNINIKLKFKNEKAAVFFKKIYFLGNKQINHGSFQILCEDLISLILLFEVTHHIYITSL